MIKSFLIHISFSILLFSSEQIILVVAPDFDSAGAKLEFYEGGKKLFATDVNIGKNGLGWGMGEVALTQNAGEAIKKEGDQKAPAGIFRLTHIFGYENDSNYKMPYLYASKNLICVDDSSSNFYNEVAILDEMPKSYESMRREDDQYKLGVVVAHNTSKKKDAGSCIFLHIYKEKNAPTAGCSAMSLEDIKVITKLLDSKKNPLLIQIPKSSAPEILQRYPQLKKSSLLRQ